MKLNKKERILVQIERACGDLRRGMAVAISSLDGQTILVFSPDNNTLKNVPGVKGREIVISKTRANYLFPKFITNSPVAINADGLSDNDIAEICFSSNYSSKVTQQDLSIATKLQQIALRLAKISEIIPAVITYSYNSEADLEDFIRLQDADIESYMQTSYYSMVEATSAPLHLLNAAEARIVAYRPNIGAPEHYAIIIGNPGSEPLVRVHSSCYTGDLLASLSCDCRDQLQSAIELMGNGNGGIILYLMQDGRGIGLVNKLRTYTLQHNGMDTVEANRALGFDDDERLFLPAAEILRKLGIKSVKLLTNNPKKASGLEECGIEVTECVPHIMESNKYNEDYLQTKVDRMGHKF